MQLDQYTKKELVEMLQETFVPLEFYSNLEISLVAGGKPFALPQERKAHPALIRIREIQKQALVRMSTPVVTNNKPKPKRKAKIDKSAKN